MLLPLLLWSGRCMIPDKQNNLDTTVKNYLRYALYMYVQFINRQRICTKLLYLQWG